jgi:hypothetical protein
MAEHADEKIFDVVVLGAGAGGMAAALFAALRGLSVIVVEKASTIGGTTAISAGTAWIPGTIHATDPSDSPENVTRYLSSVIGKRLDQLKLTAFLANGPAAIAELDARTEVKNPDQWYTLQPLFIVFIFQLLRFQPGCDFARVCAVPKSLRILALVPRNCSRHGWQRHLLAVHPDVADTVLQNRDVRQRIAVDGNEIADLAGRQRVELVAVAQQRAVAIGGDPQHRSIGKPKLRRHDREFLRRPFAVRRNTEAGFRTAQKIHSGIVGLAQIDLGVGKFPAVYPRPPIVGSIVRLREFYIVDQQQQRRADMAAVVARRFDAFIIDARSMV